MDRHLTRRGLLAGAGGALAGLGLTGCVGMDTAQPTAPGALTSLSTRPVTLRFGVAVGPTEEPWAKQLAADFHKLHPNITIDVQPNAQITDIKTLVTNAVSGTLPDIMRTTDVLSAVQAEKGLFLDLTPYFEAYGYQESDFVDNIMKLGKYSGRQLVVPRGVDQVVVAYNPKLFKKFGVPLPHRGWTWDDFLAASKALTQKVGSTQYWALGIQKGANYTGYPVFIPFMRGWGGDVVNADSTRATLDDPRVIEGVAQMMDYYRTFSPAFSNPPADPFLGGTAAMNFYVRPLMLGDMVNPQHTAWLTDFVPGFVNFPLFPTPKIGAGMQGWAGTVNTKHPHETAAFLLYTLSRRGQSLYSTIAAEVPVRHDLATSDAWQKPLNFHGDIDQSAFYDLAQYQSYPPSKLPIATNGQMATAIADALDAIRLEKQTPAQAMRQANTLINQTLKGLK
ncbi:ABC transporter substrate-binding protein [Streptomyces odontomachi]|uniref:ABC transporter substrate-binding protein n=1 Tax=Streptomyces odontomachi TaxID=2944940 RepID=UPI00210F19F2|nr:extracellular solute-binding protein [Streptomyces sp. ODS25]